MSVGSHDQPLITTTFEASVLGSSGWKIFGAALSCVSWEGVQRIVVAKRFDLSVQSEGAPQGWRVQKQVTGKKLFFWHF